MKRLLPVSILLVVLTACGDPYGPDNRPPLLTQLPRPLSTAESTIIDGVNAFAFDLMREATRRLPADSNAFLSPLSASMALGMALNGANGETYAGMQTALGLGALSESEINQGYRDLLALLSQLDSKTEMRIANSTWGHSGLAMLPAFVDAGRSFFDAEVHTLDFSSPSAVSTINDWVRKKTNGKIPAVLDEIAADEVLFLINAIYFKGAWRDAFDRKDTQDGPFAGADGRVRTAPLMNQTGKLRYQETADYQAVELLYGNGAFAMTVLLPQPDRTPAEVLAGLNPFTWRELAGRFSEEEVNLTLPRFTLEYGRRLNDDLAALGMGTAFDPLAADFDRIADVRPNRLYLTRVDQKTFVDVNEEGTEAAAATAVGTGAVSAPPVIVVDRPFVFAIHERLSGTVLFLGIMNAVGI
jgi:serine protease inhibitor